MKVIINNIRMGLDDNDASLRDAAAKKLNIRENNFKGFSIAKESVDARRKPNISIVYSVVVELDNGYKVPTTGDIRVLKEEKNEELIPGSIKLNSRPIVVGCGPAGMFAGLILSRYGYRPIILERGECVEKRTEIVTHYWETGELDAETNVQFGEGGAGTFSDGKLTTRINDRRCEMVREQFHKSGAHSEILYKARPHIGSDVLKTVVLNMRKEIESCGGEVRFKSKLSSLIIKNGRIRAAIVNGIDKIDTDIVVLAVGHSSRDTYEELFKKGIRLIPKPFSIGVRIEHPQELINRAQYGEVARCIKLGSADYQLFYKTGTRTVYSFCMCPGGVVTASASEQGTIVTNGMSEFARDKENANSALAVSVTPQDFGSSHPLAGIEFQRKWERTAFEVGGGTNSAPVQRLKDFMERRKTGLLGSVRPSYTGDVSIADINMCLPGFIADSIRESIPYFNKKLKGFGMADAVLTGVETRTSSPVRILRGRNLEAEGIEGLYPAGEGAGYAGGIVSAAVDGIRIAECIIRTYSRPM